MLWTTDHHSAKHVKECLGGQGWGLVLLKYREDLNDCSTHESASHHLLSVAAPGVARGMNPTGGNLKVELST